MTEPMETAEMDAATEAEAEEGLAGTFTRYVEALAERSDALGALLEATRQELRKVLARELRRRSLWSGPPAYVGLYGWQSWSPRGEAAGPLEELLQACYEWIFQGKLAELIEQRRVRSIDGLVVFHVRNFLTRLQRDHDPLGYRVFEMLKSAVRAAVAARELHVIGGPKKIRNATVLAASPDADPARAAAAETLAPIVLRWVDGLLPGLVTAGGEERRQVVDRLRRHLFDLESEGVAVFRFKDVIDPLKHDVRARWAALRDADGEVAEERGEVDGELTRTLIYVFRPEDRLERRDAFWKLVGCVADLIERLDEPGRTRPYLETLWSFLRRFAVDVDQDRLPSHRNLERELRIPRERFPPLYEKLGELIRRCQATLSGAVVELDRNRRRASGARHG
jgi:hypothetical protein